MKLYNSLSHKKEEFIPIEANKIQMYVCGQTVYDYCHLGHARKAIVFDMIRRWFIASGYAVTFVENITDIDDKIIKRALENNESIHDLTTRFTNYMYEDFDCLGIMRPDAQPKATEYISQMLKIIASLVKQGFAYCADNGDVYYAVRKFEGYGKLSGKSLDDLKAGSRVGIDSHKKDPLDFVLWKAAKENEPYWESEFGRGRPGWHIECSAMSEELLGKNFDIHGGGQDLQFPHHENEIAQSEAHSGCKFANYWLHNGFLNIDDEKMSKSLGNFFTVRDVLKKFDPEVLRLFMLKTHYRSPLNFDDQSLNDATAAITRLYTAIKPFAIARDQVTNSGNSVIPDRVLDPGYQIDWKNDSYAAKFKAAMDDDFNTSLAIGVLFELALEINKTSDMALVQLLTALANTLGLLYRTANEYLQSGSELSPNEIEELIVKRRNARATKNFALSDKIRDDLLAKRIILEDGPSGTTWRKS